MDVFYYCRQPPVVSTRTPTGRRPITHHDIYGRKFIFKFSTTQMQKILQEAKEKDSGKPLKTSSSHRRIFVQPKVLRAVLEMTPRSDETTKLWLNHGRQVAYMVVSMRVHNFISRSHEVPNHCFRHYHATYLLMQGVNVKEVSKRLGHSSITTTLDLYAHWVPEMAASVTNTIGTKCIL